MQLSHFACTRRNACTQAIHFIIYSCYNRDDILKAIYYNYIEIHFCRRRMCCKDTNPPQASGNLLSEFTDVKWIHLKSGRALEPNIYTECAQDQSDIVYLLEDFQITEDCWGNGKWVWNLNQWKGMALGSWGSQHYVLTSPGKICFACKEISFLWA